MRSRHFQLSNLYFKKKLIFFYCINGTEQFRTMSGSLDSDDEALQTNTNKTWASKVKLTSNPFAKISGTWEDNAKDNYMFSPDGDLVWAFGTTQTRGNDLVRPKAPVNTTKTRIHLTYEEVALLWKQSSIQEQKNMLKNNTAVASLVNTLELAFRLMWYFKEVESMKGIKDWEYEKLQIESSIENAISKIKRWKNMTPTRSNSSYNIKFNINVWESMLKKRKEELDHHETLKSLIKFRATYTLWTTSSVRNFITKMEYRVGKESRAITQKEFDMLSLANKPASWKPPPPVKREQLSQRSIISEQYQDIEPPQPRKPKYSGGRKNGTRKPDQRSRRKKSWECDIKSYSEVNDICDECDMHKADCYCEYGYDDDYDSGDDYITELLSLYNYENMEEPWDYY